MDSDLTIFLSNALTDTDDYYDQLAPKKFVAGTQDTAAQYVERIAVDQTILLPRCI